MKKGFTLVELSIVLVIVGLLIGGILVAQSMISTSKITSQVAQFQQFDAGTMSFKAAHKYLPGDSAAFGGDGDGIIDIGPAYVQNYVSALLACENTNFWNSIAPEQYARTACGAPGGVVTTSGPTKNVPVSKIGKTGSFIVASGLTDPGWDRVSNAATVRNYYVILDPSQGKTVLSSWYRALQTNSTNSPVTPEELLSLDKKADNGLANSGDIIAGGISGMYSPDSTAVSAACNTAATYNLSNKTYECTPLVRIGAQAGDVQ